MHHRYHELHRIALLSAAAMSLLMGVLGAGQSAALAQVGGRAALLTTPAAPTITSTGPHVYVDGVATNYVGTPGQFTLSDGGSTVTGYYYGLFGASPNVFVPADSSGQAVLAITPYSPSVLTISVDAVDGSSSPSSVSSFVMETLLPAGNIASLAWWKLNGGHKTVAADSTGHGHPASLSKDAAMTCPTTAAPDGYRCSLAVTGLGGQAQTGPALLPIVSADGNFSVSAWVNLTKCASSCVALSADGTQTYEFSLKYQRVCTANGLTGACWKFSVPADDSTSATVFAAASAPGSAKLAKWTELTGVFDATHGALTLYVNGVLRGHVGGSGPWTAASPGPVRIGNLTPGGTTHDWSGRLSNVCLFYGPIQPADVTLLYQGDSAHPHNGCAALDAKYP